jgi:isopentenyl-diphosphate delta-isomerase
VAHVAAPPSILLESIVSRGAEQVIVVDERDRFVRTEEKLHAHRTGLLHRAVSVCLVNESGALLLQRRAVGKYHSANLWSNTCCGHPRPGERAAIAAHRRLAEELGLECELRHAGTLRYWARVGSELIEHEVDHLYVGNYTGDAKPNPGEVSETAWVSPAELLQRRRRNPGEFTAWFFLVVDKLMRLPLV